MRHPVSAYPETGHRMSTDSVAEPAVAGAPSDDGRERIKLDVSGMTCGSCAARVQRALARQPGVADARSTTRPDGRRSSSSPARSTSISWSATVERAGYGAAPVGPERDRAGARVRGARSAPRRASRRRWCDASRSPCRWRPRSRSSPTPARTTPRRAGSCAALAVPVQFWCGLPFLRSAWRARVRARPTWTR